MKLPQFNRSALAIDGVAIGSLAILTIAVYAIGIAPAWSRAEERVSAESQLTDTKKELADLQKQLTDSTKRKTATEKAAAKEGVQLEPLTQTNHRLNRINELAAEVGVEISQLTPGKPESSLRGVALPIKLAGHAKYDSCVRFIAGVRAKFPDVAVMGLTLGSMADRADAPASLTCDLVWYAANAASSGNSDRADGKPRAKP